MKIAIVSLYDINFREFVQTTLFTNHIEYCERHGYNLITPEVDFNENKGWEAIKFLLETLPKYDWVWFVGPDTLVTNHTIRIEDKIDDDYHFIIASDPNGPNAHSYLVRNSKEGREWLEFIWTKRFDEYYWNHPWADNKVIHDFHTQKPWSDYIKVEKQKYMNSYLYQEVWGNHFGQAGVEGQWSDGDWLLHMPGTEHDKRVWIVENWKNRVIR